MPRMSGTEQMFNFVEDYLRGDMSRIDFDLDFNYYLREHYKSIERKYPGLAEALHYYLAENGFESAGHLSDADHKKLIRKQWKEFKAALRDGML